MPETRLHTCMLCEAICGLSVEVDGDRVVSIRGDKDDPFSHGHICPKAAAIDDIRTDPDRVLTPLRRGEGGFARVGWGAALDEAAERIAEIQDKHGRDSVALYLGNPLAHNYSGLLYTLLLWKTLGTRARYSATSIDQLPQMLAALKMFGHQALLPVPDIDRTDFFFALGANPLVSNGSIMSAPGVAARLKKIKERGGRIVVVDPRRTETAEVADTHLAIRPGTDAFLLLAILHVLFEENLTSPGPLARFTDGLDTLAHAAKPFSPDAVAAMTTIDAATIRKLARDFAAAKHGVCYGRVGICVQEFGGVAAWLVYALNVVTGSLDREGGYMFTRPAVDLVGVTGLIGEKGSFDGYKSRVRGLPEFGGDLPISTLAEEIDTPGDGRIRALVTVAGNPVLSSPNGKRLDRALAQLDFMVSVDLYKNETTRHAHLILPATFGFEKDHFDMILNAFAVRNTARYVKPIFEPAGETRHDWEILLELSSRIAARYKGSRKLVASQVAKVFKRFGPRGFIDMLMRVGPQRLSLKKLEARPHGMDLGALTSQLPRALHTPGKRILLAPAMYTAELPRLRARLAEPPRREGDLVLIGRRHLRSNNSWMHNSHRLVKGREACTLLMNPEDARSRRLSAGQRVEIKSRVGAVVAALEVSDEMARGVVSLPHGWGHDREGAVLGVARAHAGASVNDVTDEGFVDALSATSVVNGVHVEVSAGG